MKNNVSYVTAIFVKLFSRRTRGPLHPLACLTAALFLAACGWSDSVEVRYSITLEVETPAGLRTGSSVWSFTLRPGGLTSSYNSEFRGEAVAVDMPGGRTLYALLAGGGSDGDRVSHGVQAMLPENVHRRVGLTRKVEREAQGDRVRVLRHIGRLPRRRIALDCGPSQVNECLLLVHFRDPADPTTVEAVPHDRLKQIFGPGVQLRAVYLEITADPPSFGLKNRLPWLDDHPEKRLRRADRRQEPSPANHLSYGEFQRR